MNKLIINISNSNGFVSMQAVVKSVDDTTITSDEKFYSHKASISFWQDSTNNNCKIHFGQYEFVPDTNVQDVVINGEPDFGVSSIPETLAQIIGY